MSRCLFRDHRPFSQRKQIRRDCEKQKVFNASVTNK